MAQANRYQQLVAEAKRKIREISPQDAAAQAKVGEVVLIDVRDEEEWNKGHIPNAVRLSRGTIELEIEDMFPDVHTPIVCHCGGGGRSALVAESLQKMGYTNVQSMAGGFKAWRAAGLPTETD